MFHVKQCCEIGGCAGPGEPITGLLILAVIHNCADNLSTVIHILEIVWKARKNKG